MAIFTYTNPTVGGSEDTWGTTLNANWDALGAFLGTLDSAELAVLDGVTATTAELNLLDGVTATTAEINILDGVTATAAELNILDGVTATTAELNFVDGVTSAIQTQLDGKAANAVQAEAVWQAGTGTTESLVSPAKIKAAIIALYSTASAPDFTTQLPSTSVVVSASHGLGVVPSRWRITLVCTATNLGYAVGDEISISSHSEGSGSRGNTPMVNSTIIQNAGNSIYIVPKTGGAIAVITNASWDYRFDCWK